MSQLTESAYQAQLQEDLPKANEKLNRPILASVCSSNLDKLERHQSTFITTPVGDWPTTADQRTFQRLGVGPLRIQI